MRVHLAGEILTGRAVDLRSVDRGVANDVTPSGVAAAIRDESGGRDRSAADTSLAVECPSPGPIHDRVGVVRAEMDVAVRPALAAAARSRGHVAPQADDLAAVEARLDELDVAAVDLEAARRRVAEAGDATEQLRERVATLQGRVRALRDADADPAAAESELADATRRLSEVQTDRIAAEQALASARERARANREQRRERLRLADRADNLRRAARDHLADELRDALADAREAVPNRADLDESAETALAVARVAAMDAPLVLAREIDGFEDAESAAQWLDGPVIRI
ncbi:MULTISPECIES: hypothetical protein [Halorussus]|uniref:DUF7856 family protein n=1 Tax=Halorussus TaxID=1070314 RepID=UPI000E2182C6|nr:MULTISPECIES: hypothetical protein [Halorussus]NHN60780.1 hypothetical protein [Halorussus sp. JP-T4]